MSAPSPLYVQVRNAAGDLLGLMKGPFPIHGSVCRFAAPLFPIVARDPWERSYQTVDFRWQHWATRDQLGELDFWWTLVPPDEFAHVERLRHISQFR